MLKDYFKEKIKLILMIISIYLVFLISFALYHLPIKAILYPTVLCFVLTLAYFLIDFIKIRNKYRYLKKLSSMTEEIENNLPVSVGVLENAYNEIISHMQEERRVRESIFERKYQDMIDYYTLWAHQIKTPIAAIKLTLQNEDSILARQLSANLFRIEQYVEMVLAYLRLDSASKDYIFKEYDVDEMIRSTVKKFSSEFILRKIALDYKPVNHKMIVDEKWFSFVLEQVISNALKYTVKGTISIYMEKRGILCISDTGIGIRPEDLPRVFERGYTGYNGRIDKKASGIGLYLSKEICKNLGIEISIDSELEEGTVVKLNLQRYEMVKE